MNARLAGELRLQELCDRLGAEGLRSTGSAAHRRVIRFIEEELAAIDGLAVRDEAFEILGWQPVPEGDLARAATLRVGGEPVGVAGAVPYSRPATGGGALAYLAPDVPITPQNATGKVVVREFPHLPIPYDSLLETALHSTPDAAALGGQIWDRPGFADGVLHRDLIEAGTAGAAAVVVAFDLPRDQVAGYFEPHRGTHYGVPAVFVGAETRERLRRLAVGGADATVRVTARTGRVTTRNVFATLPGQTAERMVVATHTDGNTWIQENGVAALLVMAEYFASVPIEQRHRTIEFAFTTAHLHISREGAVQYAAGLDRDAMDSTVACALALEHLGARELVPVSRGSDVGRCLEFTGEAELALWCVGPSTPLQGAVIDAVRARRLPRMVVATGIGDAVAGQIPETVSFGGLGTYFHTHLIPTASIISGPWSLWAPTLGASAVDVGLLRRQTLAACDVLRTLDGVPRGELAGRYAEYRVARAAGAQVQLDGVPPEIAPG